MKKIFLLFAGTLLGFNSYAQLPVSTMPQNKKAVLEEFTGIYCTFCPAGHLIASNLMAANSGEFFAINVHVGSFAAPGAGDPDFRTSFGTSLANQSNLSGYPAGTVNRREFAGLQQNGTGTAMSRSNWSNATGQIRSQAAYVNIAVDAQVDEQTRQLRVITQYYYTDSSSLATNKLNVALLQNNIEGPQTGADAYYPANIQPNGKYLHQHMLRHLLTGQFGVDITNTVMGSTRTDTFFYTIPASLTNIPYDLGNLEIVAFIAEGQQQIINAGGADVTVVNHQYAVDASLNAIESLIDYCPGTVSESVWVRLRNNGAATMTAANIAYSVNGGTASNYAWTGSLPYGASEYVTLPALSFTVQATNTFNVTVTTVNGAADNLATNNSVSDAFNEALEGSRQLIVEIFTDNYPGETSWEVKNTAGTVIASRTYTAGTGSAGAGGPDANKQHRHYVVAPADDCYTLTMMDSYGDGMGYFTTTVPYGRIKDSVDASILTNIVGNTFTDEATGYFGAAGVISAVTVEAGLGNVQMFPNPTSGEFTVSFESTVNNGSIKVVDLQGRVILNNEINNVDVLKMDVSELGNGIYMVLINADGKVETKKITVLK